MRIVLLCGGSGKRLWPLSNDIRSKVFLRLLTTEDGVKESMIERICRQLDEAGLLQSSCIVTHHSQAEITRRYVGDNIPIISEPFKRGTFTAVALAASYLHEKLQTDPDETICILPADTYVDTAFFRLLHRFPDVLGRSKAELALLGTKPVQPSDQFGYIVPALPKADGEYAFVRRFIEKPNKRTARRLMAQQAMWNCGVFAFPLRFMLTYLKDKGHPVQIAEWLANYEQLPEASFDREVVETTLPVVAMEYGGHWTDLGSWMALTGHMKDRVIVLGHISDDSADTHLINELPYPIEIIGVPGIIAAASTDGILIASKEHAHRIKERLALAPQIPMYEEKRWGSCRILSYGTDASGVETMIKQVRLAAGMSTSYHIHHRRQELLTVVMGSAEVILEEQRYRLNAGDVLRIPAGAKHGIKAITPLELVEVLLGSDLAQENITRIAVDW